MSEELLILICLAIVIIYFISHRKNITTTKAKSYHENKKKPLNNNKAAKEKVNSNTKKKKIEEAKQYGWTSKCKHKITKVYYKKFDFNIGGWSTEKVYLPYNNTEEYIHLHTGDMYNTYDLDYKGKKKTREKSKKIVNSNKEKRTKEDMIKSRFFENKRKYPFECSVVEKDNAFLVKVKGVINGPMDRAFDVKYSLELWDTTDERKIVQSIKDIFRSRNNLTCVFEKNDITNSNATNIRYWKLLFKISKRDLRFSMRGERKVLFKITVSHPENKREFSTIQKEINYINYIKGYDEIDPKEDFEEAVIKTSMLISAVDGELKDSEANIVKQWILKRLNDIDKTKYKFEKERMNNYIVEAYKSMEQNNLDIYDTLIMIDQYASEVEKLELFQICLDVAVADKEVHDLELEMLYDIVDTLHLNPKHYRKMMETTLPIHLHLGDTHIERILGIDESCSPTEIKKVLLGEYKKWGNRVTHKDPKIRHQAEKMIHLISEKRKECRL